MIELEAMRTFCVLVRGSCHHSTVASSALRLEASFSSLIPTLSCCPDQTPKYFHISFGKILGGLFMAIAERHTSVHSLAGTSGNPGTGVCGNLEHVVPSPTLKRVSISLQNCHISWVPFL